jgi:hypothetical protein
MEEGTLNIHHTEQPTSFPMKPPHTVPKARFGNYLLVTGLCFKLQLWMLRYLLVFTHVVRGVHHTFLNMCVKMTQHEVKHMFHFEDDFGNVLHKEINGPEVCHVLYEYLPLIKHDNTQRSVWHMARHCGAVLQNGGNTS